MQTPSPSNNALPWQQRSSCEEPELLPAWLFPGKAFPGTGAVSPCKIPPPRQSCPARQAGTPGQIQGSCPAPQSYRGPGCVPPESGFRGKTTPSPATSSPGSNRFEGKIKFPGPCSRNKDIFLPRQLIHGSGSPAGAGFQTPGSLINHSHGLSSHHSSRSGD